MPSSQIGHASLALASASAAALLAIDDAPFSTKTRDERSCAPAPDCICSFEVCDWELEASERVLAEGDSSFPGAGPAAAACGACG